MTITKLRPTFTFDRDRLDALKAIAPEAFADGKVNWEALREALGDRVEDEGRDAEHFGLFWPGKRDARRLASTPSAGTLRPAPGEGVNDTTTRHIFIEGDNLEVLKLLQKSYAGQVKMIYIDPPYNTGQDFVYRDDFRQPLDEYLRLARQLDETGNVVTTNTRAGGRYHSAWLTMMFPRFRLARQLLCGDGVIFVSIDDTEVANLRLLLDEVFGEENFVANIIWQKKYSKQNDATWLSTSHDHILLYAKNKLGWAPKPLPRTLKQLKGYSNPDGDPRGPWQSVVYTCNKTRSERPNLFYPILHPKTNEQVFPSETRVWGCDQEQHLRNVAEKRLWWGPNLEYDKPRMKVFLNDVGAGLVPDTLWLRTDVGDNQDAKRAILDLFVDVVFDTPKPPKLISRMLEISTEPQGNDIVMDFFAGSATTAQAVLEINRREGGNRRFIMVQLPEPTAASSSARKVGYGTIVEIGKERVRRVIKRMLAEDAGKLTTGRDTPEDLGFRVFKLDRSHYKAWRDFEGGEVADLQTLFDRFESPLVEGWKPEDVLVEVMLIEGFPLDSTTETLPEFTHNTLLRVSSDLVAHRLYVCLDASVHDQTIADLRLSEEDIFICLDAALTDEAKVRLEDGRRVKVI